MRLFNGTFPDLAITIILPSRGRTNQQYLELKSLIFYQTSTLLRDRPEIPPGISVFQTKKQSPTHTQ